MATGAQLQGADELVRTLHDAARSLETDGLSDAERKAGELLATAGSHAAPVLTGRLAASHGFEVVDTLLTVTAATPYAALVHARNPWLTRTVDSTEERVADIYLAGLDAVLDTVKGT